VLADSLASALVGALNVEAKSEVALPKAKEEVNGLLTYDREVAKIDPADLRSWHGSLGPPSSPSSPGMHWHWL